MRLRQTFAAFLLTAAPLALAFIPAQTIAQEAAGPLAVGAGATITPPESWAVTQEGAVVRFAPPEADVTVSIVPVESAATGEVAAALGWQAARPGFARTVRIAQPLPARDGWDEIVVVNYETSPAEKAAAQAIALRKDTAWTVVTVEGAIATLAKRGAQLNASAETLRPAAFAKESFAGKEASPLDAARIEELKAFVASSMEALKIPGVGLALIDDGRIVYEGGIGVKDIASGAPVDKDTAFMIASNTKGMATLLLATLVEEGRLDWEKPVTDYMPTFRLGSEETTKKVLVKHLVCACTGLPRKDMQWLFNTGADAAAADTFTQLAATEPTSGFGEVFQYNNLMASAAGYLAAHIIYPEMEIGAAFDRAMDERIFDPLGMSRTNFDTAGTIAGNWAKPYDTNLAGTVAAVDMKFNDTVMPYRPAGGAWSTSHDMALYVMNELAEGMLPNGKQMVSPANLLARRVHYAKTGENAWYGMGLEEDASSGVSVIQHGGSLFGYKSNWFAIPSAGVGAVVLTNADSGGVLANTFKRRLLEVLYDAKPEATENIANAAARTEAGLAKFRSEINLPVSTEIEANLVGSYSNAELGPLTIAREGDRLMMNATSIWSEIATKANPDGTLSIVTISPGFGGADMLVTTRGGKRAIVLNDSQHEYVFVEAGG